MLYNQALIFKIVVMAALFILPLSFKERLGWATTLVWALFLSLTAYWAFDVPDIADGKLIIPLGFKHTFTNVQALQILVLLMCIPFLSLLKGPVFMWLSQIFFFFIVADSGFLLWSWLQNHEPVRGLMDVHTSDSALILCYLVYSIPAAFFIDEKGLWPYRVMWVFCFVVSFHLTETTGHVALLVGLAALLHRAALERAGSGVLKSLVTSGFVIAGSISVYFGAMWHIARSEWEGSRRDIWTRAFSSIHEQGEWLLGRGPGSFVMQGLTWSQGEKKISYIIMHSDVLQIFFEYGAIAGLIFVAYYVLTLTRLYQVCGFVYASACMFGVVMLSYFPLHYAPGALLAASYVVISSHALPRTVSYASNVEH